MTTLLLLLRRTLAFLYDSLLLIAVYFVVTALLLIATDGEAIQHPAFYALLWVIGGLFFTGFWRRGGQTLGMAAWRLRLIDERLPDDSATIAAPSLARLWSRYLAGTLLFGFGFVWALVDTHSRTANDRLSRTRIINDSEYLKDKA